MTPDEVSDWLRDAAHCFPELGQWFRRLPEAVTTRNLWVQALERTELADALAANRAILDGTWDRPTAWSHLPNTVRAYAGRLARDREADRQRELFQSERDEHRRQPDPPLECAPALDRILALMAGGVSHREACREVLGPRA